MTSTVILREVAVSHAWVQRALAYLADALAGEDGFRDCARNDEVWFRRVLRDDEVWVRRVLRE